MTYKASFKSPHVSLFEIDLDDSRNEWNVFYFFVAVFFLRCSTSSLSGRGLLFFGMYLYCGCKIEQLGIFEDSEIGDHLLQCKVIR